MSCVSAAELSRFVASGEATLAFVDHVDGCARCAAALGRQARSALAATARPRPFPAEAALAALVLAVAVMVWPRPVLLAPGAAPVEAGVPDVAWRPAPPLAVAALDGGRATHR